MASTKQDTEVIKKQFQISALNSVINSKKIQQRNQKIHSVLDSISTKNGSLERKVKNSNLQRKTHKLDMNQKRATRLKNYDITFDKIKQNPLSISLNFDKKINLAQASPFTTDKTYLDSIYSTMEEQEKLNYVSIIV